MALLTEYSVAAPMRVVFADVVLARERVFVVPGALVHRGTARAATLSVVHAGSHENLAFYFGKKSSTKADCMRT